MMHPKVDEYLTKTKQWQDELHRLREILVDSPLAETFKWRNPCYTYNNTNVAIIGGFKEYCTLSFFKGALLKDDENLLVKAGENSQSTRLFRFTSVQEINKLETTIQQYIYEAIALEKAEGQSKNENKR